MCRVVHVICACHDVIVVYCMQTAAAFSWNGTSYVGPAQKQSQLADLQAQKKQKEEDEVIIIV